jgi:hypothetical protein
MRSGQLHLGSAAAFALTGLTFGHASAADPRPPAAGATTSVMAPKVDRSQELPSALDRLGAKGDLRTRAIQQFASLPNDLQNAVLLSASTGTASAASSTKPATVTKVTSKIDPTLVRLPFIADISPTKAGYGEWVHISGAQLTATCVVLWDNVEQPTTFYLDSLWFKVKALDVGKTHSITVLDKTTKLESAPSDFLVISARSYRGIWGWQFNNFTTNDLSWSIFRDYFTPAAVEYAPNKPYTSAWNWYSSTYRIVARGGDCFGMSVRSIRTQVKDYSGLWNSWWPNHLQNRVWDYPWVDPQIGDSIREDQAGQLSREVAALVDDRWHHQTHKQAVTMIWNAIASGDKTQIPVLAMWVNQGYYGHAVVDYQIGWDGNKYILWLYDNNRPYSELETNAADSQAYVDGNGNFSYVYGPGWPAANRMIALLYKEIAVPVPHLPADAAPTTGLGADCTIVVFESQTAVQQITDETGHTFYVNGQENVDPSTRIADAMRYIPMGSGKLPPDAPAIYIFNHSTGKSLAFDTAGNAPSNARIFSPGSVTSVKHQGGRFVLQGIMQPTQELNLPSPEKMQLQNVELISVQPDRSERVFQVKDFKSVAPGTLKFSLSTTRDALNVSGASAQFGLAVQGQSIAGARTASVAKVATFAGRVTTVKVPDFKTLQTSSLRVETQ